MKDCDGRKDASDVRPTIPGSGRDGDDGRRERRLIDLSDAAEYLGTTARHLRRLVDGRAIPHYKVGGKLRFDTGELDRWLDGRRRGPSPEAA